MPFSSLGLTRTGTSTIISGGTTYEENTNPSTVTATSATLVTVTSCFDNKCSETVVSTGFTVVTDHKTVYTTWCPETVVVAGSQAITVTVTEDFTTMTPITTGSVSTANTIITKVTKTRYYTPKSKTETQKLTNLTLVNSKANVPNSMESSTALPTWKGAANNVQFGTGSLFALISVFNVHISLTFIHPFDSFLSQNFRFYSFAIKINILYTT